MVDNIRRRKWNHTNRSLNENGYRGPTVPTFRQRYAQALLKEGNRNLESPDQVMKKNPELEKEESVKMMSSH